MISYPTKNKKINKKKAKSKNWVVPEKSPHLPDRWDSGNSHRRGGQGPRKSRQEGGLNSKKSSAGVISTDSSCN